MKARRRMRALGRACRLTLAFAPWVAFGCGNEGSSLGRGPELGQGGSTTGGTAGAGGGGAGGLDFPDVPQSGGQSTGGQTIMVDPPEPPGKDVLTFVHGVVDVPLIAVCFVTGEGEALGEPAPAGGLGYGESLVIDAIEGVDFAEDAAQPLVIAGDLALIEGSTCAEALDTAREIQDDPGPPVANDAAGANIFAAQATGAAGAGGSGGEESGGAAGEAGSGAGGSGGDSPGGAPSSTGGAPSSTGGAQDGGQAGDGGGELPEPPRLQVGELPLLPAGTMSGGRSLLLVASGCLGGRSSGDAEHDELACGAGYDGSSTLGAVLVRMSRRFQLAKLGMQVVHASAGTGIVDVSSAPAPGVTDSIFTLASQLRYGVILPRSPRLDVSAAGIGAARVDWRVRVVGSGTELYTANWRVISERSGLMIEDGHTYALVLLGPWLGLGVEGFWNPPRAALFTSDPLPASVGAF